MCEFDYVYLSQLFLSVAADVGAVSGVFGNDLADLLGDLIGDSAVSDLLSTSYFIPFVV